MNTIASFTVNHDKLEPGLYVSRVDGDIKTFDLRTVKPNTPPFMENSVIHTFEHLFATIARNSDYSDKVIYFGPMGCRTGFYFLVRDMDNATAISFIKEIVKQIAEWRDSIPGSTKIECGNYLEHDLDGAKELANNYYNIITNWTSRDIHYAQ